MSDPSRVLIPGTMIATYEDGKITGWTFVLAANDAGYFGPTAHLMEGDPSLDISTEDGPFWTAVGDALTLPIGWE